MNKVSLFSGQPFPQWSPASTQKFLLSRLHVLLPFPTLQKPWLCRFSITPMVPSFIQPTSWVLLLDPWVQALHWRLLDKLPLLLKEEIHWKRNILPYCTLSLRCYFRGRSKVLSQFRERNYKGRRERKTFNPSYMPRTVLDAFTDPISFNSQNNPVRQVLLYSFNG